MEGELALIFEATKNASRFLLRDYYELENLQSSNNNTVNFSNKSCNKVMKTLSEGLSKYFKHVVFDKDEVDGYEFHDKLVVVETIDGFNNFSRAIPFFAVMVTILKKRDGEVYADKAIMNFPALGEVVYVEKGKGAFLERYNSNMPGAFKLKMSKTKEMEDVIAGLDKYSIPLMNSIPNFRFYNSYLFPVYQLLAGKVDILCIRNNPITREGIILFIAESGGCVDIKNKQIIASNLSLFEKAKELIS